MASELYRAEAAELASVTPDTFSAYVARGQAPQPIRYANRTPIWSTKEILDWIATRPRARKVHHHG